MRGPVGGPAIASSLDSPARYDIQECRPNSPIAFPPFPIKAFSSYETCGKFSKAKFEETCLPGHAEIFQVVGGDFSFYQFLSDAFWAMASPVSPESERDKDCLVALDVSERKTPRERFTQMFRYYTSRHGISTPALPAVWLRC